MEPRRLTPADMPWLHELCAQAYPPGYYDRDAADAWVRRIIESPDYVAMRGKSACMICGLFAYPYAPAIKIAFHALVASFGRAARELLAMTALCAEWAKANGARALLWTAATGVDFGPLAKRFGAHPISPAYALDFSHG